jgi:hypothetical protein
MTILLLSPRYTFDSIALWKAAIDLNWDVERLQNWQVPERLQQQEIVLYGEPLFASLVTEKLGLQLIAPEPNWLTTLPYFYVQREIIFSTLEEARNYQKRAFIKPAIDKCFPAKVYDSGKQLPKLDVLEGSTPVLISELVSWEVEFRCFVCDRQVITMSPYWRDGKLAQTEDGSWQSSDVEIETVRSFCDRLLKDTSISISGSVVIDIGKITDQNWAVVEANSAWASGIYGCDPTLVLSVIRNACIKVI